jgi:hypothetical protein
MRPGPYPPNTIFGRARAVAFHFTNVPRLYGDEVHGALVPGIVVYYMYQFALFRARAVGKRLWPTLSLVATATRRTVVLRQAGVAEAMAATLTFGNSATNSRASLARPSYQ